MHLIAIDNVSRPLKTPLQAIYCASFLCRLRGLTFRRSVPPEQGLLLVQPADSRINASIHMLGVLVDLAVIWINSDHVVVDKVFARRWHPGYIPSLPARFILEISSERLEEFEAGDRVEWKADTV